MLTLDEAFIMTAHTGYIMDKSFVTNEGPSQDFMDRCAQLLERNVSSEVWLTEETSKEFRIELTNASYNKWMEIVNNEKS